VPVAEKLMARREFPTRTALGWNGKVVCLWNDRKGKGPVPRNLLRAGKNIFSASLEKYRGRSTIIEIDTHYSKGLKQGRKRHDAKYLPYVRGRRRRDKKK